MSTTLSVVSLDFDPVDELTELLLDALMPALLDYQREVGLRLGLTPPELVCLDELRRAGGKPVPASLLGRRTGLTRSAIAKLCRRLEERGHVDRLPRAGERETPVVLRAHPERDAEIERLRGELRALVDGGVDTNRLRRYERHQAAATWTVVAAWALGERARLLAQAADVTRTRAERRRAREAAGWGDGGVRW